MLRSNCAQRTTAVLPSTAITRPRVAATTAPLLVDALDVLERARVDLDRIANPDEQRDHHFCAGLHGGRLLHVTARVAANAGLRGSHLQEHERRERDVDRTLVEEDDRAREVVLHEDVS